MLASTYGIRRFAARGARPYLRIDRDQLGPAELHHAIVTMECDLDGPPMGEYFFGHLVRGSIRYRQSDGSWESSGYGADDVFLALQPDIPWRADIVNAEVEFASLREPLLAQVADTAPGRRAVPIRFTGYRPATAQDARRWLSTFTFVRDHVLPTPAADQPLVTGAAARLLAATALSVFPNNTLAGPTADDRHDASPPTLRRAVVFIDDNAHRDIGIADIAAAASVTTRAVQLAFRRHLDTTPLDYLRRVRLAHAHRDLVTADPAHESVTSVAYRWGFPNPSRFAILYRQTYGVSPSHTLRKD
ncbi:MAG TPA: helix-turn-helix transcriptional regulator [Streptosporangiaceae bacterium]